MSNDFIHLIPTEPDLVVDKNRLDDAVAYFHSIAPQADKISSTIFTHIQFVDCAANFERIGCPSCGAFIEFEAWQTWIEKDFDGEGFVLSGHEMPCCGARHTLHELAYEWPQGFARSRVSAMNANIGKLTGEHCRRFEEILGCPVRVIYQHI